jgi:hypothetical protein
VTDGRIPVTDRLSEGVRHEHDEPRVQHDEDRMQHRERHVPLLHESEQDDDDDDDDSHDEESFDVFCCGCF